MALVETTPDLSLAGPVRGVSPLLRLQSDERLVTLTRRGNQAAYETLVARYQARLLAFCRHMLASREDAEDVLQEVFAAAYRAMVADDRPLNVRPWLYKIARNRSLNHLRRQQAVGVDSMDVHLADHGVTTADRAQDREAFRELLHDVGQLAEQQRTALLLREIDDLSYDQIAEAMDTTVPAVKSLLVRARVGLAESAQARALGCEEVRLELGAWSEGLGSLSAPVRRHVKDCSSCHDFKGHLKQTNKALAALAVPAAPLLLLQKLLAGPAAGGAGAAATTSASSSLFTVPAGALASKAAAGLAAAALVTGGAIEAQHVAKRTRVTQAASTSTATAPAAHAAAAVPVTATTAAPATALPPRAQAAAKPPAPAVPATPPAALVPATPAALDGLSAALPGDTASGGGPGTVETDFVDTHLPVPPDPTVPPTTGNGRDGTTTPTVPGPTDEPVPGPTDEPVPGPTDEPVPAPPAPAPEPPVTIPAPQDPPVIAPPAEEPPDVAPAPADPAAPAAS